MRVILSWFIKILTFRQSQSTGHFFDGPQDRKLAIRCTFNIVNAGQRRPHGGAENAGRENAGRETNGRSSRA